MSIWFITGCSTGLGRALAEAVLARGDRAAVTARDSAHVAELADRFPDRALALSLDVTRPEQITAGMDAALEHFGRIDVLVNNAGHGYRSAIEEGDSDEVAALFAADLFGPVELIKAVLPGMRGRRSGTIVNISSIGAKIGPVGAGYYAAAKAALEGVTSALRKEVGPLGIAAMAVEPGGFRTDYMGRSMQTSATIIDDYDDTVGNRRRETPGLHGHQRGDPAKAAQAIITAVISPDTPGLLLLGPDAVESFRAADDAQRIELDKWEAISRSTDY